MVEQVLVDGSEFGRKGALVRYWPEWLSPEEADTFYTELHKLWELAKQDKGLFGNPAFRKTLQIGDEGIKPYKYSGSSAEKVHPWAEYPVVEKLRDKLAKMGIETNLVLINFYLPNANLSFHSDNEDSMVDGSTIASTSFGSVRRFRIRELLPKGAKPREWKPMLGHGSLLTMEGDCQKVLEHALPKMVVSKSDMEKFSGCRINLTLRKMQVL